MIAEHQAKSAVGARADVLASRLRSLATFPVQVMEVCGTHTVAIARSGLRSIIPGQIRLLSGPGCPVCVTSAGDLDRILLLARENNVTVLTFGDMLHVPGSRDSLEKLRAAKNNVRTVYSAADALALAESDARKEFVFVAVGFETTAPSIAAAVLAAKARKIKNLSFTPLLKLVPPALMAILKIKERRIDGFILPGHVSTVIGIRPYRFVAREFRVPGVISGFDPLDVLESLVQLIEMISLGKCWIANQYSRVVKVEGNPQAINLMRKVFKPAHAEWRAIGRIPDSGLDFNPEFSDMDSFKKYAVPAITAHDPPGCRCGDMLLGMAAPEQCPLFRGKCSPSSPVGPCMVSSEGACSAAYHYGDESS